MVMPGFLGFLRFVGQVMLSIALLGRATDVDFRAS